jgi:hypothetical protein
MVHSQKIAVIMDRQYWMAVFGVAALVLYSLSWLFKLMYWPGSDYLRIASLVPFLIGGSIWLLHWQRRRKAQRENRRKPDDWNDLVEVDEEREG